MKENHKVQNQKSDDRISGGRLQSEFFLETNSQKQSAYSLNLNQHVSSTRVFNDVQKQENEENYISGREFIENTFIVLDNSEQISKSQYEILLQQTERQKLNCIQPMNQTIYPKINLHEKQQENSKMESLYDQYDSNLLTNPTLKFKSSLRNSQIGQQDCQDQESNFLDIEKTKLSQSVSSAGINDFQTDKLQDILQKNSKIIADCPLDESKLNDRLNQISEQNKLQVKEEIIKPKEKPKTKVEQSCKIDKKQIQKKNQDKLWNVFVIRLGIFSRFLRNMKNLSQSYKFRAMTLEQKEKFNDLAFFYSQNKKTNTSNSNLKILLQIFVKIFLKIKDKIPVFDPLNYALICLELAILASLIAQTFILPLVDSFKIEFLQQGMFYLVFYSIPFFIFSTAILVKLNTGFFKENIIISDRKKIFINYYQSGELFLDLITILSFLYSKGFYVYPLLVFKFYQIQSSIIKVDHKFSLTQRFAVSFQISKLVLLVVILAHINGCIFNQVASDTQETWLTKNNLQDSDWYVKYVNSLYFSFITMATVGFGDITPVSLQEKIFVIFMVVYSCGVFGYILSSIGNIFNERAQRQENYKRQLLDIIQYMRTRNIDQTIQSKVFQYLHYLEKMDNYNHKKGQLIVQKLSPDLQQLINITSYYPFLKTSNYFKLNFKDSTLINASLKMKELTFGPGQIVFNQNEFDNRVYFVLKGKVQLSVQNQVISTKDEKDKCFGISEFFTGEARNLEAKSMAVSQILYLEFSDFKEVLLEDPLEYEKFCSLKDQIVFSKISVDQSCYFCNKYSHIYDQCPLYTFKNQRLLIIEKNKRSINLNRKEFVRRFPFKSHSLQDNARVKLNLKAIRLSYLSKLAFDKNEMIHMIINNPSNQNDFEFYKSNNSFQLNYNEEEQIYSIQLLNTDDIIQEQDDYYSEEEYSEEKADSVQAINHIQNPPKRTARCSIFLGENFNDEQKIPSSSIFINVHNQQKKRGSIMQSSLSQSNNNININTINSYGGDKLHQSSQTNIKIQNFAKQQSSTSRRTSVSSYQLNRNTTGNSSSGGSSQKMQHPLLNQIISFINQFQDKYSTEKQEENNLTRQNDFFIINDFDLLKNFIRYFPKSNHQNMIAQYNLINQKKKQVVLFKNSKKKNKFRSALLSTLIFSRKKRKPSINKQMLNPSQSNQNSSKEFKTDFQIQNAQQFFDPFQYHKADEREKKTNVL